MELQGLLAEVQELVPGSALQARVDAALGRLQAAELDLVLALMRLLLDGDSPAASP